MIFALVGNQNSGKTTIFNEMTALNQHVGNFPGVTVETVSGQVVNKKNIGVVDLPGLYSLNTVSKDEEVTKEFIFSAKPNVIINVVDSTNLERNLYLTLQLKELNIPMIIALNMIDKFEKYNGKIDIKKLEKSLGIPIVEITNANKIEIDRLISLAINVSNTKNIEPLVAETKDEKIIIKKYKEITRIYNSITKKNTNKGKNGSYYIDKILTNKILGIPIFLSAMFIIFLITFNIIGPHCTNLINKGLEVITDFFIEKLEQYGEISPIVITFIKEGFIGGIGCVVSFLPIIVTLYFFLSMLEDSGYMTRIAFIMDAPLRKIGLSGRSIVPMLLGFGCSVPAILSTRTIQSEKERRLVLTIIPFISCSAKIPIYSIIVPIFFKEYAALAMIAIYCIGIVLGIISMAFFKRKLGYNDSDFFIMELPNYRMPTLKNTWRLMWNKSKEFINKAFSIIFIASIAIWFLKSFDYNLNYTYDEKSMLAFLAKKISPIFAPIGLKDWRIITSLIVGITAKEATLSTLNVFSNMGTISTLFTRATAISFLSFFMLYTPCMASISVIKKEYGIKAAMQVVINQLGIAYTVSFILYNLCTFFNFF